MWQIWLHTYPSKKLRFPKPPGGGRQQSRKGQPWKRHFSHIFTWLSDVCQEGTRGWCVPKLPELWRQVSAQYLVSYVQGCGNIYSLCSHHTVSVLVSVLSVLFHINLKADPAWNLPGRRWSMKSQSVSKYVWNLSVWDRLHGIKGEAMGSSYFFFVCKQHHFIW